MWGRELLTPAKIRLPVTLAFFLSITTLAVEKDAIFEGSKIISEEILKKYPPDQFHYVGIGGSPAPVMAYLEASVSSNPQISVAHIPFTTPEGIFSLSSFRSSDAFEASVEHMKNFYETNPVPKNKKVLFVEYADTGEGVMKFKLAHDEFTRRHSAAAQSSGSYLLMGRGQGEWGFSGGHTNSLASREAIGFTGQQAMSREFVENWLTGSEQRAALQIIDKNQSNWTAMSAEDRTQLEGHLRTALTNFAGTNTSSVSSSSLYFKLRDGMLKGARPIDKWSPTTLESKYEPAPETTCSRIFRVLKRAPRALKRVDTIKATARYDFSKPVNQGYKSLVKRYSELQSAQ